MIRFNLLRERRWYLENAERVSNNRQQWRIANRAKVNAQARTQNATERRKQWMKKYRAANREKRRAQSRMSYRSNPERYKKWQFKYRELHPDNFNKTRANWQKRHPEYARGRARLRRARKMACTTDNTAEAFCRFVRSKKTIPCYYCGKPVPGKEAHIDHVIAISRQGNHASDNLCASCPTCNLRKNNKLPSELHFTNQPLLNL